VTLPTFVSVGASAAGTGDVTANLPASYQADDLLVLFVEHENDTVVAPTGYTEHPNSPVLETQGVGTDTVLSVFWKIAASGSETPPFLADPGNHMLVGMAAFRGTHLTDPFHVSAAASVPSNNPATLPGVTTTIPDCLIALFFATERNEAYQNPVNANLANLAERFDAGTGVGSGGSLCVLTGELATPGATGATTVEFVDAAASQGAALTTALRPPGNLFTVDLNASATPVATVQRAVSKPLTSAATPVASVLRAAAKALAAVATPAAALTVGAVHPRTMDAAATPVAALTRQTGKGIEASSTPAATLRRAVARTLNASATPAATLRRAVARVLSAAATPVAALVRQVGKLVIVNIGAANLYTFSSQFDNAVWTKPGASISADATTAPDGTTTADKLVENTGTGTHILMRNITGLTAGQRVNWSIAAKAAGRSRVRFVENGGSGAVCFFNLATGQVESPTAGVKTSSITPHPLGGADWWLLSVGFDVGSSANIQARLATATSDSYTGDGVSGMYFWEASLTAGGGGVVATLVRSVGKAVAATATPAATLRRTVARTLAAAATPVATLARSAAKVLAAAVAPAAAVMRAVSLSLAAAATPEAGLNRQVPQHVDAAATPEGRLSKTVGRSLNAETTPAASLARTVGKVLTAAVSPVAGLLRAAVRRLAMARLTGVARKGSITGQARIGRITGDSDRDLED